VGFLLTGGADVPLSRQCRFLWRHNLYWNCHRRRLSVLWFLTLGYKPLSS
jgi:hypothetical protein